MHMRKIISIILCCLLALSAAGCSGQRDTPSAPGAASDKQGSDVQPSETESTAAAGGIGEENDDTGKYTDDVSEDNTEDTEDSGEETGEQAGETSTDAPEQVKQDLSQLDTSDYDGSFGTYAVLTDPATGVPVMDAILPYGWTAQVQCDWSFVSTTNPCIANVLFTSPDNKAAVLIQTTHDYLQSHDTSGLFPHRDYTDTSTYIVHLAYKNAGQVLDLYFNGILGTGGTVIKEDPVPDEVQSLLDQTAQTYLTTLVNGINQIGGGYGVTAQASGSEGTVSMRRYRYTGSDGQSYLADAMALCIAAEYVSPSYGTSFVHIQWAVPGVIVYTAPDEETLEKYRTQCEIIIQNSAIRNEFNHIKHAYGSYIRNMLMRQQANAIAAMTEAQAQSYLSDYDPSSYTSDDWANDWSDFIYDRNEYTTADGSTIKVGTEFDTVYQNGDEFYFGSQGSAPFGWEQLTPN